MSFTVVIPARYGSTRLEGKPLLDIGGKPMVQHVCERALASRAEQVVVATDDRRIADACEAFGARALMTSAQHLSGTDRTEEVSRQLGLGSESVIVNVQGDEPLVPSAVIDQVAANLAAHPAAGIATLCEPLSSASELFNPDIVKVVVGADGMALYFSRAPIPWARGELDAYHPGREADGESASHLPVRAKRHLGIYAYRVGFLHEFVKWPPSPLEQLESLEQLRALENGTSIHVDEAAEPVPPGVDTQADLDAVRVLAGA